MPDTSNRNWIPTTWSTNWEVEYENARRRVAGEQEQERIERDAQRMSEVNTINMRSMYDSINKLKMEQSKKSAFKANVIKKITITVNTETKEILDNKEEIQQYGFSPTKINGKEEAIINIRELADCLAMEELNRAYIKFDATKNKEEYQRVYQKQYKNILRFKQ